MSDSYDYDVFLSFARGDEELTRPIWQALSLSGLQVFWSDATLKERAGESWFHSIQSALDRSRHFILVASSASMSSEWVEREYTAFYSHCYQRGVRRLLPILVPSFPVEGLPLLLRNLEASRLSDPDCLKRVIRILGGSDIEGLRSQLRRAEAENAELHATVTDLQSRLSSSNAEVDALRERMSVAVVEAAGAGAGYQSNPQILAGGAVGTPVNPEVRAAVERAVADVVIKPNVSPRNSENASIVGLALHKIHGGVETEILAECVVDPVRSSDERWKALRLLGVTSSQRSAVKYTHRAIEATCSCFGIDSSLSQTAAEIVLQMPADRKVKWTFLMEAIFAAHGPGGQWLIKALANVTPADQRGETGRAIVDMARAALDSHVFHACIDAIRQLDYREAIAEVRDIVLHTGDANRVLRAADLLAQWRDAASAATLRKAVEHWSLAEGHILGSLMRNLYAVEGATCVAFLGGIIAGATPAAQLVWVSSDGWLKGICDEPVLSALATVAERTTDARLREKIKAFLENTQRPS